MASRTVPEFIESAPEETRATLHAARKLILDTLPEVDEYMKWGVPSYGFSRANPLFYLYGGKNGVNLGFILGDRLEDQNDLLKGDGKKDSRHVALSSPVDADDAVIRKFIEKSAELASG